MAGNNDSHFLKDITILLVGCTGSGKSATGNSILGRKAFDSMSSFGRVTTTCKREATVLQDGRILNVIDTPGLVDFSSKPQLGEQWMDRCIDMARDGIHVILMIVSLKHRFTKEQVAVVETLKHLFGARIVDYLTIVFTGGDVLEEKESLDNHLAHTCPEALKELLEKCGNRRVVLDNQTKDQGKKAEQLQQLLTLINNTVVKNGGKPYSTQDLSAQLKVIISQRETAERDSKNQKQQMQNAYNEEKIHQQIIPITAERDSKNLKQQMQNANNEEKINHQSIVPMKEPTETDSNDPKQHVQNANDDYQIQQRIAAMEKLREKDEEIINKLKQDLERVQREVNLRVKQQEHVENEICKLREQQEKAKTYNLRQLRQSNFSWGGNNKQEDLPRLTYTTPVFPNPPPQVSNQAPQVSKQSEDFNALKDFVHDLASDTIDKFSSIEDKLRNLEVQVEQIAKEIEKRPMVYLACDAEANPKEKGNEPKMATNKSGKSFEVISHQSKDKFELKEDGIEEVGGKGFSFFKKRPRF